MNRTLVLFLIAGIAAHQGAAADELPVRKAGLWQITRSAPRPNFPPQVQKICLDARTDALMNKLGTKDVQKLCSKSEIHRSGGRIEVDSICTIGASKASTHTVMTLKGEEAYHEDITVHFDPPVHKIADSTSTQDAKWLGACPADMQPGDIVTEPSALNPAPMRMNINNLFKGANQG